MDIEAILLPAPTKLLKATFRLVYGLYPPLRTAVSAS